CCILRTQLLSFLHSMEFQSSSRVTADAIGVSDACDIAYPPFNSSELSANVIGSADILFVWYFALSYPFLHSSEVCTFLGCVTKTLSITGITLSCFCSCLMAFAFSDDPLPTQDLHVSYDPLTLVLVIPLFSFRILWDMYGLTKFSSCQI
ncbi:hypothetical protein SAMN04488146_1371, partial [Bacillus nitratireducens]